MAITRPEPGPVESASSCPVPNGPLRVMMWFSHPPGPGREATAWAGFHRGSGSGRSPHGEAHGTSHGTTHGICTDDPPEQRKHKSRWVNARRVPERPVHSLGVKDSPAPAPSVSPRASPAGGRPGRRPRAASGPVLTGSSLCHPQTLGWSSPGAYCLQFAFVGDPTSAHSAA
jgi:hypothetical protein